VYQAPIYDGMTFDNQNDKEFAISGGRSRELMACARLIKPIVARDEIKNIVLGGGQKFLSPERRFDAILYFSTDLFGATS
jgi:HindVP restriction endonuclease